MSEMFEEAEEAEARLLDDGSVTVSISHICPDAIKIYVRELREGDLVFDSFGGTHEVTEVRRRRDGWTHFAREDGEEYDWHSAGTITVLRP